MPDYLTNADAIGFYLTAGANDSNVQDPNYSLGGRRLMAEERPMGALISNAIPQIIVDLVSGNNGEGNGEIRATSTTALAWSPPPLTISSITRSGTTATVTTSTAHNLTTGDDVVIRNVEQTEYNGTHDTTVTGGTTFTFSVSGAPTSPATAIDGRTMECLIQGAAVTISNGETKILEGREEGQYVRVTRSGTDNLPATAVNAMVLDCQKPLNNVVGMDNVTNAEAAAGLNTYRALMLHNHSASSVTSIALWIGTIGTARVSDSGQLGASGSGSVDTTGSLADWPDKGWCRIETSGGTLREIVYYYSRNATQLLVDADGRARLGTSAAAGANTDNIYSVPGIRIGIEAPGTDGTIQSVATEATAPTGITWDSDITSATGRTIATLTSGSNYGLWIHREIPLLSLTSAPHGAVWHENKINYQYIYSGTTYTGVLSGMYRLARTYTKAYQYYLGTDTAPNFTAATGTAPSLPFNISVTPPVSGTDDLNVTVRYVNDYQLASLNRYYRTITINSSGVEVTPEISDPEDITLTNTVCGYVELTAVYHATRDSSPADTWLIYTTTTGVNPNTGTDTPTELSVYGANTGGFSFDGFYGGHGASNTFNLRKQLGPYNWGTDLRVILKLERSSDSETSSDETVYTTTVSSVTSPTRVSRRAAFLGSTRHAVVATPSLRDTVYVDQPNNVFFRLLDGETQFWKGSTLIWRAAWPDSGRAQLYVPSGWAFTNTTISGAGTATAYNIESASSGTILYVIVNGTRRMRIDVTNQLIEADTFTIDASTTDCPVEGPTAGTLTQVLFTVFSPVLGRWVSYASIDSSGVFKSAMNANQLIA